MITRRSFLLGSTAMAVATSLPPVFVKPFSTEGWHHFAYTKSNTVKVFVDGFFKREISVDEFFGLEQPISMDRVLDGDFSLDYWAKGEFVSDVRLRENHDRTSTEVLA